MNIDNFISQIDKNIVTINCFSSIGNMAQYVFQGNPSYIETKSCNVYVKIMRQSILAQLTLIFSKIMDLLNFQKLYKKVCQVINLL